MQSENLMNNFVCVMPMAGEGTRFKSYGYTTPKPLIKVKNKPMFLKAIKIQAPAGRPGRPAWPSPVGLADFGICVEGSI